jgi:proline dehydrogenase
MNELEKSNLRRAAIAGVLQKASAMVQDQNTHENNIQTVIAESNRLCDAIILTGVKATVSQSQG